MDKKNIIITIDGPVASGKSSVAKLLADKLNYYYLNSGLLYRTFAYLIYELNLDINQINIDKIEYIYINFSLPKVFYNSEDITGKLKTSKIDKLTSIVSQEKNIRNLVLSIQRKLADSKNLVADGRDCGTRVFPDAKYKFFLTARLEIRAQRAYSDKIKINDAVNFQDCVNQIKERDERDTTRKLDPLKPARDSFLIDNSDLSLEETCQFLLSYIKS